MTWMSPAEFDEHRATKFGLPRMGQFDCTNCTMVWLSVSPPTDEVAARLEMNHALEEECDGRLYLRRVKA